MGGQGQHHLLGAHRKGGSAGALARQPPFLPRPLVRLQPLQPVSQQQLAPGAGEGPLQGGAEGLHRAFQVPQPQGVLGHLQHRGAVEGGGAVGGLLGIQLELQVEKVAQPRPLRPALASRQPLQIGHGGPREQPRGQGGEVQGPQQLAQVPGGARRQHRIAARKGPAGPMQGGAEPPETLTPRKLALALGCPGSGIAVQPHRRLAIAQVHHAPRIQGRRRRRRYAEMAKQPFVDAARLQPCHLGGPHIKAPGAPAEAAGATAALGVGLQQGHRQTLPGQQGRRRQAGDAGPHHHHVRHRVVVSHGRMVAGSNGHRRRHPP